MKKIITWISMILFLVVVGVAFFIYNAYQDYSRRNGSPKNGPYIYLGTHTGSKLQVDNDVLKNLIQLVKDHPREKYFEVEWRSEHFWNWLRNDYFSVFSGDECLGYERSQGILFQAQNGENEPNLEWNHVSDEVLSRAIHEKIPLEKFDSLGCKSLNAD